ncbi:hypothetical protein KY348_03335 [Candidatus Woesearchaeota archaeon]|nr:hypothetical protein [Candidatus Woesearchaeota archaeon]
MDAPILNEIRDLIKGRLIINPPNEDDQWDLEKLIEVPNINLATEPQIFQNPKAKQAPNDLVIVNWNIAYGDQFEKILNSLKNLDQEIKISIITLQEVDKNSPITDYRDVSFELAEALGFSAVFGASMAYLNPGRIPLFHDNKPCVKGNAVLTRLSLEEEVKILRLPPQYDFCNHRISEDITQNDHWGNRMALEVTQDYNKNKIRIISTQLEDKTYSHRRARQAEYLVKKNKQSSIEDIFICGDFNTLWSKLERTEKVFKKAGYKPVNKYTSTIKFKLPFRLDNIYAKTRMNLIEAGVDKKAKGSDHYPVWAVFK